MSNSLCLVAEENGKSKPTPTDSVAELRGAGISQAGISSDITANADTAMTPEAGGMPPAGAPVPGAAPAAPAPAV